MRSFHDGDAYAASSRGKRDGGRRERGEIKDPRRQSAGPRGIPEQYSCTLKSFDLRNYSRAALLSEREGTADASRGRGRGRKYVWRRAFRSSLSLSFFPAGPAISHNVRRRMKSRSRNGIPLNCREGFRAATSCSSSSSSDLGRASISRSIAKCERDKTAESPAAEMKLSRALPIRIEAERARFVSSSSRASRILDGFSEFQTRSALRSPNAPPRRVSC